MPKLRKEPPEDYLKYWRVIRYYIQAKNKISASELDMLLFLYSERYFQYKQFREYNQLMTWDKDRFYLLLKNGWIEPFRLKTKGLYRTSIYQLSYKSINMIRNIYKLMNGEEIPDSLYNPLFYKNVRYTDKVYRNMIKQMNEFIRQQRHHAPE